ncbi:MAG: type II secretion system GspH family protein [Lentisphaeraceae bacterium]|nr:type II secretion system GspH family protein [Lentisphaeraceae bacterium]
MQRKFTLNEFLILLAVMAILISLLFPAVSKAREKMKLNVCQSNLYHIGMANTLYAYSNNKLYPLLGKGISGYRHTLGRFGDGISAERRPLNKYYNTKDYAECPSDKGQPMFTDILNTYKQWGSSYTATSGRNIYSIAFVQSHTKPLSIDSYAKSDKKIVSGDHNLWSNRLWSNKNSQWHWTGEKRRVNVLFQDMHVDFYTFPLEYNSFAQDEPPDVERWGHY